MKGREKTLQEIHRNFLHAVGPIAMLPSMLTEDQVPESSKIIEYVSATLVRSWNLTAWLVSVVVG